MASTNDAAGEGFALSTLGGGLRVVSERMPGVRSIALGVWIGAGSPSHLCAIAPPDLQRVAGARPADLVPHRYSSATDC